MTLNDNGKMYAGTYPSDRRWEYICQLSEVVVEAWLREYGYTPPTPSYSLTSRFLNKAYTIVTLHHEDVFAIYLHDYKWWLIKQDKDKLGISETQQMEANADRIKGY